MCYQCQTKPVYEFTNQRKLCRTCYIRWFEKKVLYTNRKFNLIKRGDVVSYFGTQGTASLCSRHKNLSQSVMGYKNFGGFREVVLKHVLQMFVEKSMIELVEMPTNTPWVYTKEVRELLRSPEYQGHDSKEPKSLKKIFTKGKNPDKIAIALTTDLEADKIIHTLIKGNANDLKNVLPVNNKIIKPLYLFLDEEVLLYAKLKRLKFIKPQIKKNKISKFIDELEKKHPEIKRAIVSSYLKLYND